MYELIVFDWDGTLMDSEARIVTCMQQAARDLEYPVPSASATREIIGLGLREAIAKLFQNPGQTRVEALANQYRRHFLGDELAPSELFSGARELLQFLLEEDYFLAVATGKSRRGLNKEFNSTGLGELFHASRCADEAFSKPHPQMLEDILDQLGIEPQRTLVVGDTEYDMQMAISAGADALGVGYGVHEVNRLLDSGALACLDSLQQMPEWLSQRTA